jgi:hypothetical protein
MLPSVFLNKLQAYTTSFAKAVATNEGEWIVKGFIDIHSHIYTISVDTKITSKVLELLLHPMFVKFAHENELRIQLPPHQNFYPDLTFIHDATGHKFAVDVKTTYRQDAENVNGMTLGAFTGYFRKRESNKNTLYPYGSYAGHFVLGVIYSKSDSVIDERKTYSLCDLNIIPSVIKDFEFFVQPKFKLATSRPGSGNTKNIGSVTKITQLLKGEGPFHKLGEDIYDDYWKFYLTTDMAKALDIVRPYTNLQNYMEYKKRGLDIISGHEAEIAELSGDDLIIEDGGEEQ